METIRREPLPTRLLFAYVRWLVRRRFSRVVLQAEPEWVHDAGKFPIILAGTHYYWWDGLLESLVFSRWGWSYAVMMEEKNLAQYPYFRRTGVFGVDLEHAAGRAAAARRAARWLKAGGGGETYPARLPWRRALVVYPHGRLVGDLEAWPPLEPGVGALARMTSARVVPWAKRIVAGGEERPGAYLTLGEPMSAAQAAESGALEEALRQTDRGLVDWVLAGAEGGVRLS